MKIRVLWYNSNKNITLWYKPDVINYSFRMDHRYVLYYTAFGMVGSIWISQSIKIISCSIDYRIMKCHYLNKGKINTLF